MKAQGYLEIDYKKMNDEGFEAFNSFLSTFMVHYRRLSTINNREYYFCILMDENRLYDVVDEALSENSSNEDGTTEYGLLTLMKDRNPIINGLWSRNGLPFGTSEKITYKLNKDNENVIDKVEIIGEAKYEFDLDKHLLYTPDEVKYDNDGKEVSRTKATAYKPLHSFYGWENGKEY